MLVTIKLVHTLVWLFFAGCIVALPFTVAVRRFRASVLLSLCVWLECVIFAANHFRCPLTDLATRYTADRAANFDIYLPLWLAHYNTRIFGALFWVDELYLASAWYLKRRSRRTVRQRLAQEI